MGDHRGPPELQYLVDDGFNRIVLYDNKTIAATSTKTPDGKYKVSLDVQARKVQADGNGAESPMPMADYIEIGAFKGKKNHETPLYMKREKLTQERQTFTIVVDQEPTRAGIDPYNKLIRRRLFQRGVLDGFLTGIGHLLMPFGL